MERHITLPLTEELAKSLHAGDTVYLTGTIYTSRDAGHKRMCEALARGEKIPFDPTDATIYYVGPTPAKPGHVIGSAGPTTSGRMDAYAPTMMSVGARGMIGIPNYANFFWIMLFVVLTLWLLRNLIYSPYGRAFIAIRDNEIAADAMGINTTKYKIMSFCIAAFIAGVAGGLYAHVLSFIQPDSFSFTKSSDFLVYLYAGGSGSLTGSVIGAVLLTILPEVLRFLADWRLVLYALILVVVMLYRSEGLCGGKEVPFLRIKRSSLYEQPLFGRKKNDTSKK